MICLNNLVKSFHHNILLKLNIISSVSRIVRLYYSLALRKNQLHKEKPIFVYQMGKVGSKTVVKTLNALRMNHPIYHVHRLTDEGIEITKRRDLAKHRAYPGKHYWMSKLLRDQLDKISNEDGSLIITLTREPVARNLSAFFHSIKYWCPNIETKLEGTNKLDLFEWVANTFLEKYYHDDPLIWFDNELQPVFGLDVYSEQFPHSEGYQIIHENNIKLLIIRLEDLDRCYRKAFSSFLNLDNEDINLIVSNTASQRSHDQLYEEFLDWLILPDCYLEKLYSSKYVKHFYSDEEIDVFRARWRKTYSVEHQAQQIFATLPTSDQ
jgi:hypothetical protein